MIELLRKRRSVRTYKNQAIETEKIEILKESLLRSPTSRNRHPWEFILVDDKNLLEKLSNSKQHGAQFLKEAPLGVVICGDETLTDVWIEDCSIAAIDIQLTAESLDLGSCWIQIRNRMHSENISSEQYIQELLNIPANLKVEAIIAIGYPDESHTPIPAEDLLTQKIKINKYQ